MTIGNMLVLIGSFLVGYNAVATHKTRLNDTGFFIGLLIGVIGFALAMVQP